MGILLSAMVLLWALLEFRQNPEVFLIRMSRTVVDGLAFSMLLFLMVSGFFIIFGLCDVINFAHGAFFMLGGFFGYEIYLMVEAILLQYPFFAANLFLMSMTSFIAAVLGGSLLIGLLGGSIEFLTIRRLYGHPTGQILLTIGYMFIIIKICEIVWGTSVRTYFIEPLSQTQYFFISGTLDLGVVGLIFSTYRIFLIFFGTMVALIMFIALSKTRVGLLIQAGIEDSEMVEALGTNIRRMFTLVFMMGSALAGLAGVILVPWVGANSGHGLNFLLYAFVIVVVGGAHYGRFIGAFAASLIVGMSYYFTIYFFSGFESIIIFVIMALVLIFKPGGLTGEA